MMSVNRFCPTSYGRTWSSAVSADLMSLASSTGYQSLYSRHRQDFDQLELRNESFVLFPHWSYPKKDELAKAGFYYTGDHDTTKCHACGLEVSDWKSTDIPREVHRRRSPNCHFINSTEASDCESSDEEDEVDGLGLAVGEQSSDSEHEVETDGPPVSDLSRLALSEPNRNGTVAAAAAAAGSQFSSTSTRREVLQKKIADKIALKRENERMKLSITCRQCHKEQIQTLFLPCRHLIMCEKCSEQIDDCILCKKRILGTVRTFLL